MAAHWKDLESFKVHGWLVWNPESWNPEILTSVGLDYSLVLGLLKALPVVPRCSQGWQRFRQDSWEFGGSGQLWCRFLVWPGPHVVLLTILGSGFPASSLNFKHLYWIFNCSYHIFNSKELFFYFLFLFYNTQFLFQGCSCSTYLLGYKKIHIYILIDCFRACIIFVFPQIPLHCFVCLLILSLFLMLENFKCLVTLLLIFNDQALNKNPW